MPETLADGHRLAVSGQRITVYFACATNGRLLAKEFIDGRQRDDQAKLLRLIDKFGSHPLSAREFDSFDGGLWELRGVWGCRVMGFYRGKGRAFLTHGFEKRTKRPTSSNEIERARSIRAHVERSIGDD